MGLKAVIILVVILAAVILFLWFNIAKRSRKYKSAKTSEALCNYLIATGNQKKALELYKQYISENNAPVSSYIVTGVLCRLNREPEKATYIFENLLMGRQPYETISIMLQEIMRLYRIMSNVHNLKNCLPHIKNTYNGEEVLYLEALLFKSDGNLEAALKRFEQYHKISNMNVSKETSEIYLLFADKYPSSAYKYLKTAVKQAPRSHKANFALLEHLFSIRTDREASLKLAGEIIDRALMRTKADLRFLEDVYYKYGEFDRLKNILLRNAAQGGTNPTVYLFLENYYKKIGAVEKSKDMLKTFILEHNAAVVIKKAYAKLTSDDVLISLFANEPIYKCADCKAAFDEYIYTCPSCGGLETINYN